MKERFQTKILKVIDSISRKKNILINHKILGLSIGLASVSVVFLMTGMLYFRNEAFITDNGEEYRVFTMFDTIDEILEEQQIDVGEYDRVVFGGVKENEAHITIYRSRQVPVIAEGESAVTVECAYDETVADVIARSGIALGEHDFVVQGLETQCKDVEKIDIARAYDVFINVDKQTITMQTAGQTAEQVLARAGIQLLQDDYIDCELSDIVTEGMTITVTRVRYAENRTKEIIPYETVYETSNLVSMWSEEVTTEGEDGSRTNISRVKFIDGVRVSETPIGSEVTKEPVTEVISKGTALRAPYSQRDTESLTLVDGLPKDYAYVLSGKSTAYTARDGSGTASGRALQIGTVAVDPNVIPYGSELYIVSSDHSYVYGYAVAADTGYLTEHGVLVDLYMGTHDQAYDYACNYGAKYVDVYVLSVATR